MKPMAKERTTSECWAFAARWLSNFSQRPTGPDSIFPTRDILDALSIADFELARHTAKFAEGCCPPISRAKCPMAAHRVRS